jgi:hypothetical protein
MAVDNADADVLQTLKQTACQGLLVIGIPGRTLPIHGSTAVRM